MVVVSVTRKQNVVYMFHSATGSAMAISIPTNTGQGSSRKIEVTVDAAQFRALTLITSFVSSDVTKMLFIR